MEDVLPHTFKNGFGALERVRLTTTDKGQRARLGATNTAGDRRIHKGDTGRHSCFGHTFRGFRCDGGGVDHQCGGRQVFQQAVVAQINRFHVLARRQHGNHHLGTFHCFLNRRRRFRTFAGECLDRLGRQIKHRQVVSRLNEVGGHGATHVAKTDKCDSRHIVVLHF